jgi:hypothetical protein
MGLGSNGVDQVRSLRKISTQLPFMNLCINDQFGPFCTKVHAVTKWSETPQLGASGAFVATNFDPTLFHKLGH